MMTKKQYNVLVADDDEAVRSSLGKLLHTEGYQVVLAANGTEAVASFQMNRNRVDLLLVDLNMPLKNGWATLDRLREFNPLLPVFILTGMPHQSELAESVGVNALIEKPIDVPGLLRLIHLRFFKPASPCVQRTANEEFPFHLLRAMGSVARDFWTNKNITPYPHGGIND